jgi:ribosome-binding factor A
MTRRRAERVADLMHRELAQIFLEEMRDPRAALASVSAVSVSGDLGFARVKVSVLGTEAERRECLEALRRATGFVRSVLAQRLDLRAMPELRFELDRGAEHSQRIGELLAELPELAPERVAESARTEDEEDGGDG